MTECNNKPAWMNDPLVQNIPPQKLAFLDTLFTQGKGKDQKQMMSFLMPALKKAKAEKLTLSQAEINACIQAIRKHSSPQELSEIDRLLQKKTPPVNRR